MNDRVHVVCPRCDAVNRVPAQRLDDNPRCGTCHGPLFDGHPVALDERRFAQHVTRSDLPIVVDFWAPWCGPCRAMAPAFEQAAASLEPRVRLAKVDTEANGMLAGSFSIRSIPTLIVFRHGREVQRKSGALSPGALLQWILSHT